MAVAAREKAADSHKQKSSSGAYGMPLPQEKLPPEWEEASAASVLWNGTRTTVAVCWNIKACRAWMMREGTAIILENTYHLPPEVLPAYPDAKIAPRQGKRKRWEDSKGRIYEWDYKKGEVEIYDKTGKNHQGGFDPNTGKQRSPRDKRKKAKK
jgi:hypothetical protein